MFNGSRFFNLLRKWSEEKNSARIATLKCVMNHYFDSLAGTYADSSKLLIPCGKYFSICDIDYVLDAVGYSNYSIEYHGDDAIVTLRNSL